jgi:phosphoglycolate phosphatase-like HAD superfamily hydrolase
LFPCATNLFHSGTVGAQRRTDRKRVNFPHWLHKTETVKYPETVIFDVDGVLSHSGHRNHLIEKQPQDWDAFFAECAADSIIPENVTLLKEFATENNIVLLTSRPIIVQPQTLRWAHSNNIHFDILIMRRSREEMSSKEFKRQEAEALIGMGHIIKMAFDDDVRNIEAFEELGIPATYVRSGYYDN